jgi:molybdopterin molybdotransferase
LLTIGGASVGERDLVAIALKSEGLELDFARIAMRPGKPLLYGRIGGQRLLGLAGNPVSALISAHVFLRPMLHRMLGLVEKARPLPEASLGAALEANGPRQHYLRAVSEWREDGTRIVSPLPWQDSSLVADLARADCLIVREAHAPSLGPGAKVRIVPFDAG